MALVLYLVSLWHCLLRNINGTEPWFLILITLFTLLPCFPWYDKSKCLLWKRPIKSSFWKKNDFNWVCKCIFSNLTFLEKQCLVLHFCRGHWDCLYATVTVLYPHFWPPVQILAACTFFPSSVQQEHKCRTGGRERKALKDCIPNGLVVHKLKVTN